MKFKINEDLKLIREMLELSQEEIMILVVDFIVVNLLNKLHLLFLDFQTHQYTY